jgi:putative SOS response-associated peptidase YedK
VVAEVFIFGCEMKSFWTGGVVGKIAISTGEPQGEEIKSCTILTTAANELVKRIHHPNNHRGKYAKNTEKR